MTLLGLMALKDQLQREREILRIQTLQQIVKDRGSKRCRCGKTISANARSCRVCGLLKEIAP